MTFEFGRGVSNHVQHGISMVTNHGLKYWLPTGLFIVGVFNMNPGRCWSLGLYRVLANPVRGAGGVKKVNLPKQI